MSQSMNTRRVTITCLITGQQLPADLLLCPNCDGEQFVVYLPDKIDHCHFQCRTCDATFCDGCEKSQPTITT